MGYPTHAKGLEDESLQVKLTHYLWDPLDLLEHLPQNQNLSILLFFTNSSVTNRGLSLTIFL